jgi:Zn finger protein HypA/HybF involved in hydrogenase expression
MKKIGTMEKKCVLSVRKIKVTNKTMLNIQEENTVVLEEYACDCGCWFLTKAHSENMICPKCGGVAISNGEFRIKNIELQDNG